MTLVLDYLTEKYGLNQDIYSESELLQYIDKKIKKSVNPKSRSNIANLYAIYALVEDYIKIGESGYIIYAGATFTDLLSRQRNLPFGNKLQNHALNSRCNEEFKKFFPNAELPIIRNTSTRKYRINSKLLKVNNQDISNDVINVIDKYISILTGEFSIILLEIGKLDTQSKIINFFKEKISVDSDSRMFELTSFVILKHYYLNQNIFIGKSKNQVIKKPLMLYKTGRTNANDGGIDYVMKPIGKFFQVTQTLDFKKFFLDIEKINRYPITFVIKTDNDKDTIIQKIRQNAEKTYDADTVSRYMKSIEDIIILPDLLDMLDDIGSDKTLSLLSDFKTHLHVEFNLE